MRVRFWGTRGSIATPGPGTVRYGGNTSCVELRTDAGDLVVLDCGTGIRLLGEELVREAGGGPASGTILLGHTHWDHIQGLPFFAPLFQEGARWRLFGPSGLGGSLGHVLAGQMEYQYFPVSAEQLGAEVTYHDLVEGTFALGDLTVRTQYLNHPALTLGYRIEGDGAVLCYLADHEPFEPSLGAGGDLRSSVEDRRHVELMAGADVVVHDAQYDAVEHAQKVGWGHSSIEYAVDAACAAEVGTLVLFHHDPGHDDAAVDDLLARARSRADGRIEVLAAAEGEVVEVRPRRGTDRAAPAAAAPSAPPAVEQLATGVVVLVEDDRLRAEVESAAQLEHLSMLDPDQLASALEGSGRAVVVVELDPQHGDDGSAVLQRIRGAIDPGSWARVAVLGVTRSLLAPAKGLGAVTDWLVWPASVTHVRTKLRAAVLRQACRWLAAPLPADEEARVGALRSLGVLDTPAEERFDRWTDAAASTFAVPIALVTLIDSERQWFKSRHGFDPVESHRDESVCAHAILGDDVLQVPDLLEDPRFADNPAVTGPGRARFYAGAPLVLDDGSHVGTLCVIDRRPRRLTEDQIDELRRLARCVVEELQRP